MLCAIDDYPLAGQIAKWAQQGHSLAEINAKLESVGGDTLDRRVFSKHRRECLHLAPRLGRPVGSTTRRLESPDSIDASPVDEDALLEDVLKVLRHRIKTDPGSVKTSELVSFANKQIALKAAALMKDRNKGDPLGDAMANAMSGDDEARTDAQ